MMNNLCKNFKVTVKAIDLLNFDLGRSLKPYELELRCKLESCLSILKLHSRSSSKSLAPIVFEIQPDSENNT